MTALAVPTVRLPAATVARTGLAAAGLVAGWLVLRAVLPHGAPLGILLAGVVFGSINSLVALSVVLVYRASRVVNFAAAEFGAVGAVLAIELRIQEGLDYFLCILVGLTVAAGLGGVLEVLVFRRFAQAPRLIVAVVTIGVAQVLNGLSVVIPVLWTDAGNAGTFTTPWSAQFRIEPVVFNGNYVLAMVVVPVVLAGLVWFLRYTHYGVAVRASADNADRAQLLGIPVRRVATVVWSVTGLLSAVAVLLRVPILGFASFTGVSSGGLQLLLMTLTAAVVGSMTSLPVTFAASVAIGVLDQLSAWTFKDATLVDAALLVAVLVVLLLKRNTLTRSSETGIGGWQAVRPVRPVPPELTHLTSVRLLTRGTPLLLLLGGLLVPAVVPSARTQLVSVIVLYAIVACSLVVLTGWAGHISLGQVAFMGVGGAVCSTLVTRHGVDVVFAVLLATVVAAALAFLIGLPALRISGPFLAVTTLAFAVTASELFLQPKHFAWLAGSDPLPPFAVLGRIPVSGNDQFYYLALAVLVGVITAVRSLRAATAGRAMVASHENRQATQAFGIDTTRATLGAFAVSGGLAGLAGALFVVQQQAFNPGSFDAGQGLVFLTMAVIGGLGSIPGAILGAVYVYGAQYLLPPGYALLATGAGIVLLLMFLPGGLGELVVRCRDALLRRAAARHGIHVPSLVADRELAAVPVALAEPEAAPALPTPDLVARVHA